MCLSQTEGRPGGEGASFFPLEKAIRRELCRPRDQMGRNVSSSQGKREMKLLILAVFALFYVVRCEEGARLLASKSLLNRYAVEGKDLTLQYNIYNVGSSAALDVELSDDSFPPEDFGIVSGMLNVKWDRIAPASNVSHTVVLRPLKAGYFNFTSATITYLVQEGGQVVVGFTSAPGQGGILAQREFDRRFSPHFLDWAAFGVMTLPSIGIPLLLWYSSKRKYDTPKTKKN
uniref:Signal sequence receptor subunit 2 n=1 Tax=Falco tinnunculus TaxID=100819 RepID=A0A8C4XKL8_FALTI